MNGETTRKCLVVVTSTYEQDTLSFFGNVRWLRNRRKKLTNLKCIYRCSGIWTRFDFHIQIESECRKRKTNDENNPKKYLTCLQHK